MLSSLSSSYSAAKTPLAFYKTFNTTPYKALLFSYSLPKSSYLTFDNNNDKAPVTSSSTLPETGLSIANLDPLKITQGVFTIYVKHRFNSPAQYLASVIHFRSSNITIQVYRDSPTTLNFRIVDHAPAPNLFTAAIPTTSGQEFYYYHYFISFNSDRKIQVRVYNYLGTSIYSSNNTTALPSTNNFDILNMNRDGADISRLGRYEQAGIFEKILSGAECQTITNMSL